MNLTKLQTYTLGIMLTVLMSVESHAAERLARAYSRALGFSVTSEQATQLASPIKPLEILIPEIKKQVEDVQRLHLESVERERQAEAQKKAIAAEETQREKEAQDGRQLLKARRETEERLRQEQAILKKKSEKDQVHVAEVFSLAPEEAQRGAIGAQAPRVIEEEKEHKVQESQVAKVTGLKVGTAGRKKRKEPTETAHTERKKTKTAVRKTSEVFHDPQEGTIEKERKGMPIIPLLEEPKNHNIEEFREDYKRFLKKTSARFPAVFSDPKNVESLIVDDSSLENGYIPLRKALTASLSILKPLVDDPQLENVNIQLKKALTTSLSVLKSSKPAALSEEKGALPDVGESVGKVYSSENSDAESDVEMKEEERANDESLVLPHDPQDGKIKKERKGTPVIPLNEEQMQQQLEVVCGAYEHFLKRAFTKYRDLFSDPEIDKDPIFHPINIDPLLYKLLGQVVGDLKRENGRGRKLPHKALTDSLFNPLRPTSLLEEEGSSQEADQSADETYSSQNSEAVSGDEMSEEESDSVQNSQEWENGGT